MSYLLFILGFGLTVCTIIDLVWTTLWIDGGAGPLSRRVALYTWKGIERLTRKNNTILTVVGPVILVVTLLSWIFFMWAGLTILYSADPQSIIDTRSGGAIQWYERVYFTGYSIFTLGIGDYSPQPGFWQVTTAAVSGVGIMFLTLGASYVINVVNAVVKKRSFARSITGLGMSSENILRSAWNGTDFHQLDLLLMNASSDISELTQQHQAYPLLHFYHSKTPEEASAVSIAILDDLLTLLHFGLKDKESINVILVQETRSSINTYLDTLTSVYIRPSDKEPNRPDITRLEDTGIPFVTEEVFARDLDGTIERRRKLLGAVISDRHEWPEYEEWKN